MFWLVGRALSGLRRVVVWSETETYFAAMSILSFFADQTVEVWLAES